MNTSISPDQQRLAPTVKAEIVQQAIQVILTVIFQAMTGPYRFVRHLGYVGAIIQSLAMPFLLGSLWALIPGGIAALLMIACTVLEDSMLRAELDGYEDYARRVRYRLLPGLW